MTRGACSGALIRKKGSRFVAQHWTHQSELLLRVAAFDRVPGRGVTGVTTFAGMAGSVNWRLPGS